MSLIRLVERSYLTSPLGKNDWHATKIDDSSKLEPRNCFIACVPDVTVRGIANFICLLLFGVILDGMNLLEATRETTRTTNRRTDNSNTKGMRKQQPVDNNDNNNIHNDISIKTDNDSENESRNNASNNKQCVNIYSSDCKKTDILATTTQEAAVAAESRVRAE